MEYQDSEDIREVVRNVRTAYGVNWPEIKRIRLSTIRLFMIQHKIKSMFLTAIELTDHTRHEPLQESLIAAVCDNEVI